jgi:hypothetical protein
VSVYWVKTLIPDSSKEVGVEKTHIHEEIEGRLILANGCSHAVQNLLPSWLLSKNVQILQVVLYGCGYSSLTLRMNTD